MTLDLSRVQKLHEAAILAGLPGVLPEGVAIYSQDKDIWMDGERSTHFHDEAVAQAAVAWWLREWCRTMRNHNVGPFGGEHYLAWAEEIVANYKENS